MLAMVFTAMISMTVIVSRRIMISMKCNAGNGIDSDVSNDGDGIEKNNDQHDM